MSESFNVYMAGVGGQGIGLLSETLIRAADHAGLTVKGCDTHGLAQRGGIVTSHLRIGEGAWSPLVQSGSADLVIALERHEALRAADGYLKIGGTLVWYDACWQPLDVRMGIAAEVMSEELEQICLQLSARNLRVFSANLSDARMQNVLILGRIARDRVIPGIGMDHVQAALADVLDGPVLEKNLGLLDTATA